MNPKLNLQGLAGSCFHVGSVRTLKVARVQDIISLPDCCGQSLPLDEKPVANRAGAFESYEFRADQLYLTEVPSKSGSGTSYSYEMVGSHPAIGNLEREEIGRMRDGHYICIATLWHGDILLLGSLEQPMLFEGSLNSGRSRTEGNSSAWRFTGLSPYPACMLGTDIVLVADPCSLQSVDDFVLSEWNIDYGSNAELLSIPMALNPAGTIQSVTAWNDGVVYDPNGTPVDTMQWNAGQSRYEPVAGPNYLAEGVHSFEVTLNTLLKTGETCSFTFSQTFTIIGINQPPQITSGSLVGIPQVGETLTMAYSYYDVNADPEDTTAVNRIMLRRYDTSAAATADTTGTSGTLVANDVLTYVLQAADASKYLRAFFTPHAQSGATPGSVFATSVIGGIAPDTVAFTYNTTTVGTHTLTLDLNVAQTICIDWDGTKQFIDATALSTSYTRSFAAAGTKAVTVYAVPTGVQQIRLNSQNLTGTLDISACTGISLLYAFANTALTNILWPAATWSDLRTYTTGVTNITFPAGTVWNNTTLWCSSAALSVLNMDDTSGTMYILIVENSGITEIDTSAFNFASNNCQFRVSGCASLATITHGSTTGNMYRYWASNTAISALTVPFEFNSTVAPSIYIANNNNLSSAPVFSASGTLTVFDANGCDLPTLDISMFDFLDNATILLFNNASLDTVNHGTGKTGKVQRYSIMNCNLGYYSLGGLTFASNADVDMSGNEFTAAETNEWLVNADPTGAGEDLLPATNTATFNIAGNNAAPDTTSGGFNGVAAAGNIASSGTTLTTS